jgi:hypothetical protein
VDLVTPEVALMVIQDWLADILKGNGVAGVLMNTTVCCDGVVPFTVPAKEKAVGAALIM